MAAETAATVSESILGIGLAVLGVCGAFISAQLKSIMKPGGSDGSSRNGYVRESTCNAYREGDRQRHESIERQLTKIFDKLDEMANHTENKKRGS